MREESVLEKNYVKKEHTRNDVKKAYNRYLETLPRKSLGRMSKLLIKAVFALILQYLRMNEDDGASPYPILVVYFDGLYQVNKKVKAGEDLDDIERWAEKERYGGPLFYNSRDPDSFRRYLTWLQKGFAT